MATAFAVFCETDNSLTFYKRDTVPTAGEEFEGKLISSVYTGFETEVYETSSAVPWNNDRYYTVSFSDIIRPVSTAYWFKDCYMEYFDGRNLDTSNVTTMKYMFSACSAVNLDLSMFDTRNVHNMSRMFHECCSMESINLSSFNTSNVTDMSYMFNCSCCIKNIDVSSFDTSNVTDMSGMFRLCCEVEMLDLSSFDTSNVTDMNGMFDDCNMATTIYVSDRWDMSKITDTSVSAFYSCDSLVGAIPYNSEHNELSYANYNTGYFTYKKYYPSYVEGEYLIKGTTWYDVAESVRNLVDSTKLMSPNKVIQTISNIKHAEEVSF